MAVVARVGPSGAIGPDRLKAIFSDDPNKLDKLVVLPPTMERLSLCGSPTGRAQLRTPPAERCS
jgi:hypothetical protein